MKRKRSNPFVPLIFLFLSVTAFFISGRQMLQRWGFENEVLLIGNGLLFLITLISYLISRKGLLAPNPHQFMRSVYGGIMIKMFITLIAALIYIAFYKKNINKPALFTLMGLYLVYTFVEVAVLTKGLNRKEHG